MIHIERIINGEPVSIGWIENMSRGCWDWTSFDANNDDEYEFYTGGCATSRKDAEYEVRKEYREQLKA